MIGFAGVMLLIGVDTVGSAGEFLGALAMLGAALAYALGAMFAKLRFGGVPPLVVSFGACAVAALVTAADRGGDDRQLEPRPGRDRGAWCASACSGRRPRSSSTSR